MNEIYIAVPNNYFVHNPWPPGVPSGRAAMAVIWGVPDVQFVRNDHPLGDLYKICISPEDLILLRLRSNAGVIVTNIHERRKYSVNP